MAVFNNSQWRDVTAAVRSYAVSAADFKLSPFTLAAGYQYRISVGASSSEGARSLPSVVSVSVIPGQIVAILSGGSSRGVRIGQSLVLDASMSYDEDDPTNLAAALSFGWACATLLPKLSIACTTIDLSPVSEDAATMTAVFDQSSVGDQHQISVTVSSGKRWGQAATTVVVISTPTGLTSITGNFGTKFGTSNTLILTGTVSFLSPGYYVWSVSDPAVQSKLAYLSMTPVAKLLPTFVTLKSARNITMNLILPPYSLPQESNLVFTLTCVLYNGLSSTSTMAIVTNGPPKPG